MYRYFIYLGLLAVAVTAIASLLGRREIIRNQSEEKDSIINPVRNSPRVADSPSPEPDNTALNDSSNIEPPPDRSERAVLTWPLPDGAERIAKKPFGIRVSPGQSPIKPERFSGYHTGVDFEALPSEYTSDVPVLAICGGSLLLKKWASGYGGVAVQACAIDNQQAVVVYGHLRLESIEFSVGQSIDAGEKIGVLGQGYSPETDGERKHLHLGIYRGAAVNIQGYVKESSELTDWIDPAELFEKYAHN